MSSQESLPDPATASPSPTSDPPPPSTTSDSSLTTTTTTNDPPMTSNPTEPSKPSETWEQTITKQPSSDPPATATTTTTTTTSTTPYTTHYITTVTFVTVTTMIPQPTIISGSVTTVYSLRTTTYMMPTIIPDPSQPPPPTIYAYPSNQDHRGLQTWQLTLIIVAALVMLSACTSVFLVGWIREQRREKREEEKKDDDLLPVGLEPWNDPATAAAVMGSPRRATVDAVGVGHDGNRWPEYHKEADGAGNYDVNGGLVMVGYPSDQPHNVGENMNYPGHNVGHNGDYYMGTYYHMPHPQHVYGNNPQENHTMLYLSDYSNNNNSNSSALEHESAQLQYLQQLQPVVYYPKPPTGASPNYPHPNENVSGSSPMGAPQSFPGDRSLMDARAGYAEGHGSGNGLRTLDQIQQGPPETDGRLTPLSPQESHMFPYADYVDERDRTIAASPVPSSCLGVSLDKEQPLEMQGKMSMEACRKRSQMKLSHQGQGTEISSEHVGQSVEHEQETRSIVSTAIGIGREGSSIRDRDTSNDSLVTSSDQTSATSGEGGTRARGFLNRLRDDESGDEIVKEAASY
ncbi:hypothetical protein BGZ51_006784 [Haplosporangium sp. Z 767]|nr:hypothetical protein BGZ51_006784 [Haplosporangium sp. Z 767]